MSSARSGAMQSKVGNPQIYEAGDQRTSKETDKNPHKKYDEGQGNAHHDLDSKDERSIGNRLAAASKHSRDTSTGDAPDSSTDPLAPARAHGNEPSRGAQVDAELQREDEEEMQRKGA
ncbi:hypothetical protein SERLA73DRAFT_189445 [Serpula lacrymans var. lacrymans S7.3]|uniref:Uncharacterized protein n=2 Tax=Serpula lacrymans var. lacrymans TaxID=341189 RepID=F8QDP0_SERL3|nr:uncharacterized protein SERLADRAFT_480266 [Serpula lacrymans var. lacrymans S7.9]EGN93711.1 hypothetical protein SERLA73DRAFT_189445 [Serpula lacrymans var. lacrymans S7.3]EGO19081.1 hypothetical protein SERLADRAFT_480266 [Serpula lacrymans var. lacrymans S7.9]